MKNLNTKSLEDLDNIVAALDEVVSAATTMTAQGGYGYLLLVRAREKFKKLAIEIISK